MYKFGDTQPDRTSLHVLHN